MHWVGLPQDVAPQAWGAWVGLTVLWGSFLTAVERLAGQMVRPVRGQTGWWGTPGSPYLPPCLALFLLVSFCSAPYSPFPSSWLWLPKAGEP